MSTQIKKNGNWVTVAGGTRMWVGTKAALQAALDAGELVDGTAVMVTDDYEEDTTKIKSYMNVEYSLDSGEPTSVPALSPTGWFNTNLKVNPDKVAVVFRFQYCFDSNNNIIMPLVQYDTASDANGNLRFRFINVSNTTKECVKCRVFFNLIGKPSDLPSA